MLWEFPGRRRRRRGCVGCLIVSTSGPFGIRERESHLLNPPPGSTDPERFATVSMGLASGIRALKGSSSSESPSRVRTWANRPSRGGNAASVAQQTLTKTHGSRDARQVPSPSERRGRGSPVACAATGQNGTAARRSGAARIRRSALAPGRLRASTAPPPGRDSKTTKHSQRRDGAAHGAAAAHQTTAAQRG